MKGHTARVTAPCHSNKDQEQTREGCGCLWTSFGARGKFRKNLRKIREVLTQVTKISTHRSSGTGKRQTFPERLTLTLPRTLSPSSVMKFLFFCQSL